MASIAGIANRPARAQSPALGPAGPAQSPDRVQLWRVPTPVSGLAARAMLYRPPGEGPFALAVIAHASTQNALRRAQMPQPHYQALASWLVARGYAVLVPERPGHGATGGPYLEDQHGCDDADYTTAGRQTAASISAALHFMRAQPFVRGDGAVVIGHSAGGWGALALGREELAGVARIVVFSPGRGGHADDEPDRICAPERLMTTVTTFGKTASVPVTWLVAANDSYFAPFFSRRLADAFRAGGGKVDFHLLPAFRNEGHWLVENVQGPAFYGAVLAHALNRRAAGADIRR